MSAMPVVPCAQVTTGNPPAGGALLGTRMRPVTAMSFPAIDREWYITRRIVPCSPGTLWSSVLMTSPGCPAGNGDGTS